MPEEIEIDTVNEALVRKSESTSLQARASDAWAYYQAKGIKGAIATGAAAATVNASRALLDSLGQSAARYAREQQDVATEARQLEAEREGRTSWVRCCSRTTIDSPTSRTSRS